MNTENEASIWAEAVADSIISTLPEKLRKQLPEEFKAKIAMSLSVERERANKAEEQAKKERETASRISHKFNKWE